MGNQASSGPGPAARQHSAPAGTAPSAPVTRVASAAHVAPGAETRDPSGPVTLDTCATRLRRLSGDSGDKRLESPPSITVAGQLAPLCPAEERYTAPSQAAARPRARTTNHVLAARSRARHVPTVFRCRAACPRVSPRVPADDTCAGCAGARARRRCTWRAP